MENNQEEFKKNQLALQQELTNYLSQPDLFESYLKVMDQVENWLNEEVYNENS